MVEGQAAETVNEETTVGVRQSDFILQQTIFQHTQNPHSHVHLIGRRGPQGKHVLTTIKSALWTTKWPIFVFYWPIQVQFSEQ